MKTTIICGLVIVGGYLYEVKKLLKQMDKNNESKKKEIKKIIEVEAVEIG